MDYKEKYESALERARIWKDKSGMPKDRQGILDDIFPALKESEDEQHRKWILEYLYDGLRKSYEQFKDQFKCAISWLKKQGEKPQGKSALEAIHEQKVDNANKVEREFKVGDWIVNQHGTVRHIEEVGNVGYQTDEGWLTHDCYEKDFRLWSITDAKDGDVLYSLDSKQPFIYKNRKPFNQAEAYCGINIYGKFFVWNTKDCVITLDKYVPATKEQRDLLFQKMHEAGYMWDSESKQLLSLEAKPSVEKKNAWSEEDKDFMYDTLSNLTELKDRYGEGYGNVGKCIDWLKSFSPQNRWKPSKEQIIALRWVLNNIPYNKYKEEISGLLDQIKDL